MTGLPLLLLLLFWLLPPIAAKKIQSMCPLQKGLNLQNESEFYRPGDLIIGANLPLAGHVLSIVPDFQKFPLVIVLSGDRRVYPSFIWINTKESSQCEDLVQLLLHFHWNLVGLVAPENDNGERFLSSLVPMLKEKEMAGLPLLVLLFLWLLPPTSAKRMQTVYVLRNYFQSQESYYRPGDLIIGGNLQLGTTTFSTVPDYQKDPFFLHLGVGFEFSEGDRKIYLSFFRINPKEFPQYVTLVQLLLYFQWNWIGLLANEDDSGEHFISSLVPMLKEKEICLAFTQMLKSDNFLNTINKFVLFLKNCCKADVIILFGDPHTNAHVQTALLFHVTSTKSVPRTLWILTSQWNHNLVAAKDTFGVIKPFHGALQFRDHTGDISEFRHFLMSLDPLSPEGDVFLPE
ncbi:hypothetical protein E2320_022167, partial [Naja naja]